jgi:hypothetical protein
MTWLACLAVIIAAPTFAQRDMGTLLGVVTDPSGAAVPGATITITEDATGVTNTVESDATGNYIRPLLKPGTYTISAESEGFKKTVQTGVQLQSTARVQANFILEIGAVTETIEVAGLPPALQTESTQMGGTLEARQTSELPLGGQRRVAFLARTVPGVVPGEPGNRTASGGAFSANGVRSNGQNNFLLNGVDNNVNVIDFINQTSYVIGPSPEAIGEMQVMTNGYGAEYGRAAGGVVNVTIKSGTNEIHGAVFEFLQNSAANANTWEANRNDNDKGLFQQNQFGAAVGGPLIKNRTFWFADYQGTRINDGARSSTLTIPTAAMKNGDFSGIPGGIYDIDTQRDVGGERLRDRFVNDMIPESRFDPIAKALIDQYPAENFLIVPFGQRPDDNFFTQRDSSVDVDQFDVRLDHRLNDNNSLFGSVSVIEEKKLQSPPLPGDLDASGFSGVSETNKSRNAMMSYTRIWSPTIISETRAAFTRLITTRTQFNADDNTFERLGFGGLNPFTENNGGMMNLAPQGYSSVGGANWLPTQEYNNVWDFIQNISINKGAHAFKFGAEFRQIRFPFFQVPSARGQFSFRQDHTDLPSIGDSGDGMAAWLLGLAGNGTQLTTQNFVSSFKEAYSFYAMDDWKVNSKLTLNIGLRYELTSPIGEEFGRQAHLDWHRSLENPVLVIPEGKDQDAPLPVNFATDYPDVFVERGVASKYLHGWDKTNIGPRIGLAYEVKTGTVIRAAYGIFYGAEENEGGSPNRGENVPFNQQTRFDSDVSTDRNPFINTFSDGFPLNTFSLPAPISFRTSNPRRRWPLVNKWNVNIQKDLGWSTVLELGYIGSKGNRLLVLNDPNRPINSPDPNASTPARRIIKALNNSGTQEANNFGRSTYHAFTAKLEKRFSNNLQFLSSYTWGHALTDVGTTLSGGPGQRDTHLSEEYAHASFDIRHRLSNSFLYELPFQFDNPVADALVGGWQFNGIYVIQTGNYFNLGTNNAVGSFGTTRPDVVEGQNVNDAPAAGRGPDLWFNTDGVTDPAVGTFGNLGNYSNIGPPRFNFDFSLFKDFQITEGTKVQFRAESFNLWNSPQFSNPNATQGNSNFGVITGTAGGTARQMQFALRFMF